MCNSTCVYTDVQYCIACKRRPAYVWKRERRPEEEGVVYTTVCLPYRRVCVCFSSAIYLSFAVQAPHTLLLWLRWAKSHWQRHKKFLLSACLQKQQFRLERKEKNINFLAWLKNFQKRPWPFFCFFSDHSSSFGTRVRRTQEQSCTHTNSSSAAQIPIREDMWDCSFMSPANSVQLQQISPENSARGYYIQSPVRQICFHFNDTLPDPPPCSLSPHSHKTSQCI